MDHIFSLRFDGIGINEIENTLLQMSSSAEMSIYLLYTNVLPFSTLRSGGETEMNIEAHVYATSESQLLNLEEFNKQVFLSQVYKIPQIVNGIYLSQIKSLGLLNKNATTPCIKKF